MDCGIDLSCDPIGDRKTRTWEKEMGTSDWNLSARKEKKPPDQKRIPIIL